MLWRIEAPHFCAGLEVKHGVVVITANILKYMDRWSLHRVKSYCKSKGWKLQRVRSI